MWNACKAAVVSTDGVLNYNMSICFCADVTSTVSTTFIYCTQQIRQFHKFSKGKNSLF